MSCILNKLDKNFNHILINTNQNYDKNLNSIFFQQLEIKKPKYFLKNISNKSPIQFIGKALIEIDNIIIKEKTRWNISFRRHKLKFDFNFRKEKKNSNFSY